METEKTSIKNEQLCSGEESSRAASCSESMSPSSVRIQRLEEIAAMIPYLLGYAPRNCFIGVSYEREGKLHPDLPEDSPYMLGPMIRFEHVAAGGCPEVHARSVDSRGPDSRGADSGCADSGGDDGSGVSVGSADDVGVGSRRADSSHIECSSIACQLVRFAQNFSVRRMCLLWYCEDCSLCTGAENCPASVPIVEPSDPALEPSDPAPAGGHGESTLTLASIVRIAQDVQSQIGTLAIDALATDYRTWMWIYREHTQIQPDSRHPHSFDQLSESVREIIAHMPMKDFIAINPAGRSAIYARAQCTQSYIDRARASYQEAHQQCTAPPITMWNNTLISLMQADRGYEGSHSYADGCAGEGAARCTGESAAICAGECLDAHPDKTGKLLAHLEYQSVRDRVILFAVHPHLESVSRLSQRQLVKLMGEASEELPDIQRVHSIISLLAYMSISAPENNPCAEATLAYLLWWIGEGSEALIWVRAATAKNPQYSLARLVDYALRIQLPPPWVSVGKENTCTSKE